MPSPRDAPAKLGARGGRRGQQELLGPKGRQRPGGEGPHSLECLSHRSRANAIPFKGSPGPVHTLALKMTGRPVVSLLGGEQEPTIRHLHSQRHKGSQSHPINVTTAEVQFPGISSRRQYSAAGDFVTSANSPQLGRQAQCGAGEGQGPPF